MREEGLYKIGEAITVLKKTDPDITFRTLRYWDSIGLITPVRTPSGLRLYSVADLERIRKIRRLQGDYHSIEEIKSILDADKGEKSPSLPPGDGRLSLHAKRQFRQRMMQEWSLFLEMEEVLRNLSEGEAQAEMAERPVHTVPMDKAALSAALFMAGQKITSARGVTRAQLKDRIAKLLHQWIEEWIRE
jgi:DNA-binding transcriptional MerR regulator